MTHAGTIPPHGGTLIDLVLPPDRAAREAEEAANLAKVAVGAREMSDLEMLAVGALSPLSGFVGEGDYASILENMHLENGFPWTIPVTLSVDADGAKRIGGAAKIALTSGDRPMATMQVEQVYQRDREKEAQSVFGTTDTEHPGVAALHAAGDFVVAGPIQVIELPAHETFTQYRLKPAETRQAFADRGWMRVVGFQTRNPEHRAHE